MSKNYQINITKYYINVYNERGRGLLNEIVYKERRREKKIGKSVILFFKPVVPNI